MNEIDGGQTIRQRVDITRTDNHAIVDVVPNFDREGLFRHICDKTVAIPTVLRGPTFVPGLHFMESLVKLGEAFELFWILSDDFDVQVEPGKVFGEISLLASGWDKVMDRDSDRNAFLTPGANGAKQSTPKTTKSQIDQFTKFGRIQLEGYRLLQNGGLAWEVSAGMRFGFHELGEFHAVGIVARTWFGPQ